MTHVEDVVRMEIDRRVERCGTPRARSTRSSSSRGAPIRPSAGGDVTAGPAAPGGPVVAYGFVPSSAVKVTLTMRKRGFFLFRLLKPTEQVEAELYGSALHLPVKAWQGPDLAGYSVKKIEARDTDNKVVATLSFG